MDRTHALQQKYNQWYRQNPSVFGPQTSASAIFDRHLRPNARILDLGAGQGRNALFYARAGHCVTAVEYSDTGVQQMQAAAAAADLPLNIVQCDVRRIPWRADEYDAVLMKGLLHFLPQDDALTLLMQTKMQTRPGGLHATGWFTSESTHLLSAEFLAQPGALLAHYADWRVLEHTSLETDKGTDERGRRIIMRGEHVIAQRPTTSPISAAP